MKLKSILNLVVVMVLAQLMFACNSAKYYDFGSTTTAYHQAKQKPAPVEQDEAAPTLSEVALAAADEKAAENTAEPALEASIDAAPTAVKVKKAPKANVAATLSEANAVEEIAVTMTEAEALAVAKERISNMTKAEKKEMKEMIKQSRGGGVSIIEVILAIFIPPLAVFLHDGIGTSFWINIILTLLFFLPGIIHALLVVTDTI